jgi:hypothetical protein
VRADFVCPKCRATVTAPASLEGEDSPCPKCGADIDRWPAPVRAAKPAPPSSGSAKPPPAPKSPPKPPPALLDLDDEEEDRPRRRRDGSPPKRGVPPWVWMLAGAGGLVFLCCGGLFATGFVGGCRQGMREVRDQREAQEKDAASGIVSLNRQRMVEFIDHPERFKGKTLRVEATLRSGIFGDRGDSLRNYAGQVVEFSAFGSNMERLVLHVQMPANKELPNAKFGDDLVVIFVCKEGRTDSGNEAVSVARR